jgi:hypothetical protein
MKFPCEEAGASRGRCKVRSSSGPTTPRHRSSPGRLRVFPLPLPSHVPRRLTLSPQWPTRISTVFKVLFQAFVKNPDMCRAAASYTYVQNTAAPATLARPSCRRRVIWPKRRIIHVLRDSWSTSYFSASVRCSINANYVLLVREPT